MTGSEKEEPVDETLQALITHQQDKQLPVVREPNMGFCHIKTYTAAAKIVK